MGVSEAMTSHTAGAERAVDWKRVLYLTLASRALDDIEEHRLVPEKKVLYQFCARGHEMAQIILGSLLDHPHDAVGAYYRSRPLLLTLGLSLEDAFAGPMGKSGGFSDGRDIGVVCNLPASGSAAVLPPVHHAELSAGWPRPGGRRSWPTTCWKRSRLSGS